MTSWIAASLLWWWLDDGGAGETLSGQEMALKVLKKVNGKLRFLYRQGKYLNPRLRRMLRYTLIQPHFKEQGGPIKHLFN